MTSRTVEKTRNGLFLRVDQGLGMLVHSPHTGLTFAVHPSDSPEIKKWLNASNGKVPSQQYTTSLGVGWAVPAHESNYVKPHLLPDAATWSSLPSPNNPILINWLITGKCPLACKYCWAEDLMRKDEQEPQRNDVVRIAETILDYNPLVVVITGGDPLFSPFLENAIQALSGQVGIVIDTSGYTLNARHLKLFTQHKVSVRISIDSERPKINQAQRQLYGKYPNFVKSGVGTTQAALSAICQCLDAGLGVTVQSVATKKTANDLLSLGDKLYRMGVQSWRVGKVAPSEANMAGYQSLVGSHNDDGKKVKGKRSEGPYEFIFEQLQNAFATSWKRTMAVQVMHNNVPNAVVLVNPEGTFYTESNTAVKKVVIDPDNPQHPNGEIIRSKVNMLAHAERYLNLTS